MSIQGSLFGKMYPEPTAATGGTTLPLLSRSWLEAQGITPSLKLCQTAESNQNTNSSGQVQVWLMGRGVKSLGATLTLNTSEWPNDGSECLLSQILEPNAPQKYFLSPRACTGILSRAKAKGKVLPKLLELALTRVALTPPPVVSKWHKGAGGPSGDEHQNLVLAEDPNAKVVPTLMANAKKGWSGNQEALSGEYFVFTAVSSTLTAAEGTRGPRGDGSDNLVLEPVAIGFGHTRTEVPYGLELSPTLQTTDTGSGVVIGFQPHQDGMNPMLETVPPINASDGGGAMGAIAYGIYGGNKRPDRPNGGFYVREETTSRTVDTSGLNPSAQQGGVAVAYHEPHFVVRRLMPIECERLQGFPDGWTALGAAKDTVREISDGPRYTVMGNAVTVSVAQWLARRIKGAIDPSSSPS
jgi:hypothetical protein